MLKMRYFIGRGKVNKEGFMGLFCHSDDIHDYVFFNYLNIRKITSKSYIRNYKILIYYRLVRGG